MENITKYRIARSFSKKFQPKAFESEDFHAYHEYAFDVMPTQEEITKKSKELFDLCVAEVTQGIKDRMDGLSAAQHEDKDLPY